MEFKGVENPELVEVYIIDEKVHEEDQESGYPLSGPRGAMVCSLLGSMSLLDKTRIANWQGNGPEAVKEDILRCNPKVIVGLGSSLMNHFVTTGRKITDMSGEVVDISIEGQNFKYLVLMSPSYVLNRPEDTDIAIKFSQDLYKAWQICAGEFRDILAEKEVLSAHSFEEFKEIYESRFLNDSRIAYDIETNARPIYYAGSRIIGFSIGNKTSGVYVSVDSLEFHMSEDEENKVWDYLINDVFEKKDKLIIHNTMYERPYTLYCKGYEIGYDKAEDTLVMARLLKGAKEGAGLKYQAQKNLHYPDWETDLSTYISGFRDVVNRICFGPKKFSGLANRMINGDSSIFDFCKGEEVYDSLSGVDQEEIDSIVYKLKKPMIDLYSESEIENLGKLLTERIVEVVNQGGIIDSTIPYNYIPDRVLCKYGAIDSISTYDLCEYFENMMDKDSTDTVDLHKGYQNWREHMYVAYIMERNGMYWDEELVKQDEVFLTEQATRCLKVMLKSPLFRPFISEACEWKYKPIILSDYLPTIASMQGYTVEYSHETEKYLIKYNGKRVAKGRLSDIEIPSSFESQYYEILYSMFYEEVDKATHYEELKSIYNPSSSTQVDIPRKILITPRLQMGGRVVQLNTLATSPEFEGLIDQLPIVDQKFLKTASLCADASKLKEDYGKEWAQKRKDFFEGFSTMYNSPLRSQVTTPEIVEILNEKTPVTIESFDDGGVIDIYNNIVVTGIDQDDQSTWIPEFEWMINFRLFKKSQKILSSYINGSVGRESVVVVDKIELQCGKHCVERKRPFEKNIRDDEAYLLAAKWSPNTAETGRWRSAQHTVPWGSQVKKYYTSRFVGGTTLCPDYSQMEVRTLAAISKDENMLELFHSGKDFHTETAKKIYRKDEVTTAERRFSKTACVLGTTRVALLDGTTPMIKDILSNSCKDQWVYSYDVDTGNFVPGRMVNCRETKRVNEYAIIEFDDGTKVECTVDHKLLCRDGLYRSAQNLKPGDSIMPFNTKITKGQNVMNGYEVYCQDGEWYYTHRMCDDVCLHDEDAESYEVRHHTNFNKLDNRPCNILLTSKKLHLEYHHSSEFHKYTWKVHDESWRSNKIKGLVDWTTERREAQSARMRQRCVDGFTKYRNTCKILKYIKSLLVAGKIEEYNNYRPNHLYVRFEDLESYFGTSIDDIIQSAWKYPGEVFEVKKLDTSSLSKRGRKHMSDLWGDEEFVERKSVSQSSLMTSQNSSKEFQDNARYGRVLKVVRKAWIFNNQEDFKYSEMKSILSENGVRNLGIGEKDFVKFFGHDFKDNWSQVLNEAKSYNHEVVSVTIVHSDKPIPVYAPSVEKYENFCIVTSVGEDLSKSGVVSGQTFSLLYGAMEESFARNYCKGDMEYAKMVYGGFFEAYPGVKKWVDERHKEVQRDHRVSLELSNRFIPILPEGDGKGALNSMLRKSQNYPIQAQSADLTGCVIFDLQKYIEENNMKSLVFMYVHDSIEVDVYPYELIQLVDKLKVLLNESPMRRMGLPSKADVALGKSLGHEIEMENISYNEDFTDGVLELKGYQDEIYETVENWKKAYETVEILEESWKEEFVSMGELFILRKAYTPTLGTLRHKGTCKVHINYYR